MISKAFDLAKYFAFGLFVLAIFGGLAIGSGIVAVDALQAGAYGITLLFGALSASMAYSGGMMCYMAADDTLDALKVAQ